MDKKSILLIDDDPDILHMYTLKFSFENGVELVTASTPESGLQLARRLIPDLVLLDLILPKREGLPMTLDKEAGFRVLEQLKSHAQTVNIPVVVFTNLDEENHGNVERAKALGALDYWVKARFSPSEIVEKIRGILS
ncbi:MAG: response regulator [Planctomycetota bacterium]